MKRLFHRILTFRIWALLLKELRQIRRNRRLVVMLIIPPTLNIVLFGVALNPDFENLRLGAVDQSRTPESRQLISAFTQSRVFHVDAYYASAEEMGRAISNGEVDAGLVVPGEFAEQRLRGQSAEVQLVVDAVDTNTASIVGGYAARIVARFNERAMEPARAPVTGSVTVLYNPGLRNSWFITTGMIGLLLVLQGSVVAAASLVREKEIGTIEQLLMTPAGNAEIILAKVVPIFLLLVLDIGLALGVTRLFFGVPMRGSLGLFFVAGSLCVIAGIGMGMMIAIFARTQQQAQLLTFFTNPPLAILSGATTPIEAMPAWLQPVTEINPVKHFAVIARGVMIKGNGIDVLWWDLSALAVIALAMVSISAFAFRKQLN